MRQWRSFHPPGPRGAHRLRFAAFDSTVVKRGRLAHYESFIGQNYTKTLLPHVKRAFMLQRRIFAGLFFADSWLMTKGTSWKVLSLVGGLTCFWVVPGCLSDPKEPASRSSESSVVNGSTGAIEKYPFLVKIIGDAGNCSGSVLNDTQVLLAGHCGYSPVTGQRNNYFSDSTVELLLGCSDDQCGEPIQGTNLLRRKEFHVAAFYVPASYALQVQSVCTQPNNRGACKDAVVGIGANNQITPDIAILSLQEPIPQQIKRAELAPAGWEPPSAISTDDTFEIAGFGCTEPRGRGVNEPLWASLGFPMTRDQLTTRVYESHLPRLPVYWVFSSENKPTICQGDSGGPLLFANQVVGVNSSYWTPPDQANNESYRITSHTRTTSEEVHTWLMDVQEGKITPPVDSPR